MTESKRAAFCALKTKKGSTEVEPLIMLARPERFELPTPWFVAKYSIQLSYGREGADYSRSGRVTKAPGKSAPTAAGPVRRSGSAARRQPRCTAAPGR